MRRLSLLALLLSLSLAIPALGPAIAGEGTPAAAGPVLAQQAMDDGLPPEPVVVDAEAEAPHVPPNITDEAQRIWAPKFGMGGTR